MTAIDRTNYVQVVHAPEADELVRRPQAREEGTRKVIGIAGLVVLQLLTASPAAAAVLIMPPTKVVEPSPGTKLLIVDEKVPWKSWEVLAPSPFESQSQCRSWLNRLRELAARPDGHGRSEAHRVWREEQVLMLQCVSGDDPRLR